MRCRFIPARHCLRRNRLSSGSGKSAPPPFPRKSEPAGFSSSAHHRWQNSLVGKGLFEHYVVDGVARQAWPPSQFSQHPVLSLGSQGVAPDGFEISSAIQIFLRSAVIYREANCAPAVQLRSAHLQALLHEATPVLRGQLPHVDRVGVADVLAARRYRPRCRRTAAAASCAEARRSVHSHRGTSGSAMPAHLPIMPVLRAPISSTARRLAWAVVMIPRQPNLLRRCGPVRRGNGSKQGNCNRCDGYGCSHLTCRSRHITTSPPFRGADLRMPTVVGMTVGRRARSEALQPEPGFTLRIGRDHGGGAGEALCQFGRAQAANLSCQAAVRTTPNNPRRNPGVSAAQRIDRYVRVRQRTAQRRSSPRTPRHRAPG